MKKFSVALAALLLTLTVASSPVLAAEGDNGQPETYIETIADTGIQSSAEAFTEETIAETAAAETAGTETAAEDRTMTGAETSESTETDGPSLNVTVENTAAAQTAADVTDTIREDLEAQAQAELFERMNADEVFFKQSARGKCTLASAAMIMRRAAMMAGDEAWDEITESSLGSVAWRGGVGIGWSFTYHGITMVHDYVSSVDEIIALLEAHPEGIVAYDSHMPHAVALTDYDAETGIFYCSDPSETYPGGRYNITQSMISIEDVDVVWYCE